MSFRGSVSLVEDLVHIYPQKVVLERLERLYREEIARVIRELSSLLPSFKEAADEATFVRDKSAFDALVARSREALSLGELEGLLKRLLGQAWVVAGLTDRDELP